MFTKAESNLVTFPPPPLKHTHTHTHTPTRIATIMEIFPVETFHTTRLSYDSISTFQNEITSPMRRNVAFLNTHAAAVSYPDTVKIITTDIFTITATCVHFDNNGRQKNCGLKPENMFISVRIVDTWIISRD